MPGHVRTNEGTCEGCGQTAPADDTSRGLCTTEACQNFQQAAQKDVMWAYAAFAGCKVEPNSKDADICLEAYYLVWNDTNGRGMGYLEDVYPWYTPLEVASNAPVQASTLRAWAKSQGYSFLGRQGGIEIWGVPGADGWRLKLKLPSLNAPLSNFPRYSARIEPGKYIDPITGVTGTRSAVGHGELEWDVPFDDPNP